MATLVATLNAASPGTQADLVTTDNNLTYKVYNDLDSYASAELFGSHVTDADVTVSGGVVTITNIIDSGIISYKISSVDEAGNESVLSPSYSLNNSLEFLQAQTDVINFTVPFIASADYYIEARIKLMAVNSGSANSLFGAYDTGYSGTFRHSWGVNASDGKWGVSFESTAAGIPTSSPSLDTWYKVKILWDNALGKAQFYIDDILECTGVAITPSDHNIVYPIGKYAAAGFDADWKVDWIDFNGDKFEFNEGSGSTVTASGTGDQTIVTDRADVNDMWEVVT